MRANRDSPVTYARALFAAIYRRGYVGGYTSEIGVRVQQHYCQEQSGYEKRRREMASTEYLSTLCGREYA